MRPQVKEAFRRCRFFSPYMNYAWVHYDCLNSILYFEIIHLIPAEFFWPVGCSQAVLRISTEAAANFQVGLKTPCLPPEIRMEGGNTRLWFSCLFSPIFYSISVFLYMICVMLPCVYFLRTGWEWIRETLAAGISLEILPQFWERQEKGEKTLG